MTQVTKITAVSN